MTDRSTENPQDPFQALIAEIASEEEMNELRQVWDAAGRVELGSGPTPEVTAALRRRVMSEAGQSTQRLPSRRRQLVRLAAAITAVAAVVAFFGTRPVVHSAAPGESLIVELPDGTHINLAPGATLLSGGWLGRSRSVDLDGEAFFDVAAGARPFVVTTQQAEVTVLGTRFAVRSWTSEARTDVYLEEGRVTLRSLSGRESVELAPGESRRVRAGLVIPAPEYGPAAATDWLNGDFVFVDTPLDEVLADIGRRFGLRVALRDEDSRGTHVSGAFRDRESAPAMISDLALYLGLQYRETSDGFELFRPPEPDR